MDTPVLSYGDVLLRHEDVSLLQPGRWLNDQMIAFYFEYLTVQCKCTQPPLFVAPAMSFFLANGSPADAKQMLEGMGIESRALVLFAVNNNPFVDVAEGGSHWSLLVLERQRSGGEFWHVDSMGDTNEAAAKQLAATLASGLDLRAVASDDDGATCSFHAARVPQQRNGFDCGVHVLAAAAAVADAAAAVHSLAELEAALRTITPDAVTALRGSCLQLIERLSEED